MDTFHNVTAFIVKGIFDKVNDIKAIDIGTYRTNEETVEEAGAVSKA